MASPGQHLLYALGLTIGGFIAWQAPWVWAGFVIGNVLVICVRWIIDVVRERNRLRERLEAGRR